MAFPTVAATNSGSNSISTSHTVNLPSSISSGDLLIAVLAVDGVQTTTWPSGWTALVDEVQSSTILTADVFYRVADGTEGASITVATGGTEESSYVTLRITGWHGTTAPEATNASGNDANPDPPSETASWGGSEDNLWIAGVIYNDGRTAVSAYPTNYSSNQVAANTGTPGGTGAAVATDEVAADTENPGTFTIDSGENWTAFTVVVRPSAVSGITQAIGLNTETDTALALSAAKLRAAGLATETDSALSIGAVKAYPLGLNTETDTAQSMAALKTAALGLATETDTAQAVTAAKVKAIGLATSTETALAITAVKTVAIGLAEETDTAQAMTVIGCCIVDIDHETGDLTQYTGTSTGGGDLSVTSGAALAGTSYGLSFVINDTGTLYAYARVTANTSGTTRARFYLDPNGLTMASGNEFTVFWLYSTVSVVANVYLNHDGSNYRVRASIENDGLGNTYTSYYNITDAEHYIEILLVRATNSTSSDGYLSLWIDGTLKETVSGIDNYDDFKDFEEVFLSAAALDAGTSGTFYLDELHVNDDGVEIGPVSGGITQAIGLATETDTAQGMTSAKVLAVGIAAETETALSITALKTAAIGLASETDTAQALTAAKTLEVGLATETDSALGVTLAGQTVLGLAEETDTALPITAVKVKAIGQASETDSALGLVAVKSQTLGIAAEVNTAIAMAIVKVMAIGIATETDTALGVTTATEYIVAAYGTVFRPNRTGSVLRPDRVGAVNRPNRTGSVISDRQGD